jgi:hypothetical protein
VTRKELTSIMEALPGRRQAPGETPDSRNV